MIVYFGKRQYIILGHTALGLLKIYWKKCPRSILNSLFWHLPRRILDTRNSWDIAHSLDRVHSGTLLILCVQTNCGAIVKQKGGKRKRGTTLGKALVPRVERYRNLILVFHNFKSCCICGFSGKSHIISLISINSAGEPPNPIHLII